MWIPDIPYATTNAEYGIWSGRPSETPLQHEKGGNVKTEQYERPHDFQRNEE